MRGARPTVEVLKPVKVTKVFVRFEDDEPEHDIVAIWFRQYLRTIIQSKGLFIQDLIEEPMKNGMRSPNGFVVTTSQDQRVALEKERYDMVQRAKER